MTGLNHAPLIVASGFWRLPGAVLVAVLSLLAAAPVAAQIAPGDLPAFELDPGSDPRPFDPRHAISDYLERRLPDRWWANDPELYLGAYSVMIHVPDDWRGNPVSAVMNLCPPSHSVLWRHLERIELVPFYRNAARSRTTCRKS